MKSSLTKQVFTAEFRAEAVKLVEEQGLSISEVARRLDMSLKTLSRWVILAKEGNLAKVNSKRIVPVSELEAEVSRLKKEVAVLREEREILKKATAFFAKESR